MKDITTPERTLSRRNLLVTGGAASVTALAGFAGGRRTASAAPTEPTDTANELPDTIEFDGIHQAGIATPAQGHLLLTAYDLKTGRGRTALASVLRQWTTAARALTRGEPVDADPSITYGTSPAALTVTVGVGTALLDRLQMPRPPLLADLPSFRGDRLQAELSDGDVIVQLCADDPLVLSQADRTLHRLAAPAMKVRWQQQGFGGTGARRDGRTGRNLMGQLDGTNNATTSQRSTSGPVWADTNAPAWLAGGTTLVVRRIEMMLDTWERMDTAHQERVIGRRKDSGAPLHAAQESDYVDLDAKAPDGSPAIPADSHIRLAAPRTPQEAMMRRGYSYRGGLQGDGTTDQGLLFLSYQKDPSTSFVPVQQRLAENDALEKFTLTTGSALFAVLPGTGGPSGWLGSTLLR